MAERASDPLIWLQRAAPEVAPHLLFAMREGHWEREDVVALCARLRRLPLAEEFPGALATALARVTPVLTGDEPPGDLSIMPAHVFEGVLHEYPDALEERTAGLERRLRLGVADDDERRELEAIQRLHDPDGSSGPEPDSDTLDLAPEDGDTTTAAPATEPGSADEASEDALPDPVTDLPPPLDAPPPDDDAHIASKNEVGCFIIVQRKARRLVLSDGTIIDFGEAVAVWSSLLTIIESRRKHPDGGWTKAPAQKGHRDDIIRRIREAGLPPERVIERAGSRWRLAAPPKFAQPAPSEPTGGTG